MIRRPVTERAVRVILCVVSAAWLSPPEHSHSVKGLLVKAFRSHMIIAIEVAQHRVGGTQTTGFAAGLTATSACS